jgi:hypothetical protein
MKIKMILLTLIILFGAVNADAGGVSFNNGVAVNNGVVGSGVSAAASPSCNTAGSAFVTQTTQDGSHAINHIFGNAPVYGQSFTGVSGNLYSVTLYIEASNWGTFYLRWGPNQDLTTTYYKEVSCNFGSGTNPRAYECIVKDTEHPMSESTTYYFGIGGGGTGDLSIYYKGTASSYNGGTYLYGSNGSWNISTSVAENDLYMVLKPCAD